MDIVNLDSSNTPVGITQTSDQPLIYASSRFNAPLNSHSVFNRVKSAVRYSHGGAGIDFDVRTSTLQVTQPGLYLLPACVWNNLIDPLAILHLQFKRPGDYTWIAHAWNGGNDDLYLTTIYLNAEDYIFSNNPTCALHGDITGATWSRRVSR